MEQNMQYLYEYQNGKRVRNIGFMRIEPQMDKCMIQIHARQMDDVKGILFQKENGEQYIGGWEAELLPVEDGEQNQQAIPQPAPQPAPQETDTIGVIKSEEVDEYIPPRSVTYEKIQRQDISRLPRKEWRLANNSFLLHGFFNYHHLLYIEEEGRIWIGVPGIYHEKEQTAANAFGFTEFRRLADVDVDLQENERNTYEDFGYWCRQIPLS